MIARKGNAKRRGIALVYVTISVVVALGTVATMMTLSMSRHRASTSTRNVIQARYLAEGGIEAAKKSIITAIANFKPLPLTGTVMIDNHAIDYTVDATGFSTQSVEETGIVTLIDGYHVRATAEVESYKVTAHRIINTEATPIFQFAVFYTGDLEINPGPNMRLGGRVHSNSDIYLNTGGTLTVDTNYLRSVGDMYRNRKDDPSKSEGTVNVREWVKNPYDPSEPVGWFNMKNKSQMSSAGVSTTSGWDSAFTAGHDADGNGSYYDVNDYLPYGAGAIEYTGPPSGYGYDGNHTMMSGDHGVTEAVVPNVGTIQMYSEAEGGDYVYDDGFDEYVAVAPGTGTHLKGYYHGEAGLSVILKEDGTWTAHDADGADVSASLTGAVTIKNLYDARQGGNVKVAQIEMDKVNSSGVFPANGLMYASWYGLGSGKKANGIKLKSGQELKAPLTIVSESHIYVQGNYNTVNKKGASVIGDAVSLLSNAWNDTKTSASALPAATETTYNLALITGNHDTVGSGYNGGLENLPRFHEKWSGVPCNITGSLVNTWRSTFATGTWFYGGKNYEAPNRNWNYDVAFNNIANLPPYTPLAVTGREVVSW